MYRQCRVNGSNLMEELSEYYTPDEAAKALNITYGALMVRIHRGKYRKFTVGRSVLLSKKEIDKDADN